MSAHQVEEEEETEEEYNVEAIRDWRYHSHFKRKEFLIKWERYSEDENTWEPEENLQCPKILEAFVEGLSREQLNYFHSQTPDELNGLERNVEINKIIGADEPDAREVGDSDLFYCIVYFVDSAIPEEISIYDLYKYKPDIAFKFIEDRMLNQRAPIDSDSD